MYITTKIRNLFLNQVFGVFFKKNRAISLIDIGAEGGLEPRWKGLEKFIDYCGVEPDTRSSKLLSKEKIGFRSYKIISHALWSSTTNLVLNCCRQPSASSIFEPNLEFLRRFPHVERFDVQKTIHIKAVKLDEVFNGQIDFFKIDTQGAELEIIRGANNHLNSAIGLEVEVQFHKIYRDEPLFQDVVLYLELNGFEFIDFIHLKRWGRLKLDNRGQLIFADALFLRSPEYILQKESFELTKKYIALCLIYNRFDYINLIIKSKLLHNKFPLNSRIYIYILEFMHNLMFILTRGISNIQRRVHSNSRSHFLY